MKILLSIMLLSFFLSSCEVHKARVMDSETEKHLPSVGLDIGGGKFLPSDDKFLEGTESTRTYDYVPDSVFERMEGKSFPKDCKIKRKDLNYIKIKHYGFDGEVHVGELIVNKKIAQAVGSIFADLFDAKYPIEKIRLIDEYDANDNASMKDNNTSAFCYRTIAGRKKLSKHALGLAIDINPLYNPCVTYNEDGSIKKVEPEEGRPYIERDADDYRRITKDSDIFKLFKSHGFKWGGDWGNPKDYQHFEYTEELE